jgi:hypothetical protein
MGFDFGAIRPASVVHTGAMSHWKQGVQGFAALKSALQAADLDGARQAFSGLHVPQSPNAKSPLARIGQALASGDIADAQQVMQSLLDARMGQHKKPVEVSVTNDTSSAPAQSGIVLHA